MWSAQLKFNVRDCFFILWLGKEKVNKNVIYYVYMYRILFLFVLR